MRNSVIRFALKNSTTLRNLTKMPPKIKKEEESQNGSPKKSPTKSPRKVAIRGCQSKLFMRLSLEFGNEILTRCPFNKVEIFNF